MMYPDNDDADAWRAPEFVDRCRRVRESLDRDELGVLAQTAFANGYSDAGDLVVALMPDATDMQVFVGVATLEDTPASRAHLGLVHLAAALHQPLKRLLEDAQAFVDYGTRTVDESGRYQYVSDYQWVEFWEHFAIHTGSSEPRFKQGFYESELDNDDLFGCQDC